MFEVLLQADKALASGALDQAERSYWQLIVLDPTNAIAVAGLARVSLERGDRRLARTFAARALVIDPESFSAKRIIETLEGRGVKPPASDEPDLPLLAAQHLEALGRRRATGHRGAGTHSSAPPSAPPPQAKPPKGRKAAPEEGRKPLPQLPVEPLRGRRQAGRQAAATATAATQAAPRPQAPRGAKAHQALGDRGRRHLSPEAVKPPSRSEDRFAVAESAAAVEAVDEANDVVLGHPFEPGRGGSQSDELGQVLGAVDATDKDESIALRVALVSDAAQLEAAELEAAELDAAELGAELSLHESEAAQLQGADLRASEWREPEPNEAELEAAEALAAESVGPAPSRRIDLAALGTGLRVAELRVAQGEPIEPEAAAMREALAVALGNDTGDAPTEDGARAPHGDATAAAQPSADDNNEPPAEGSDDGGDTAGSKATPQRHRHGLLRRFLGD